MEELEFRPPLLTESSVWRRAELVRIPEWGGVEVEVRSMSAGDRLNYLAMVTKVERVFGDRATDWGALLPCSVIPCTWAPDRDQLGSWLAGQSTRRVFRWEDYDRLSELSASALHRIHIVASRLSGFTELDLKGSFQRLLSDGDFRLVFELAKELGMTVSELTSRMPAWELSWWRSYLSLVADEHRRASRSAGEKTLTAQGFA